MAEQGIDLSRHRSSDIEAVDCATFDIVVAMSPSIADELRRVNQGGKRLIQWDIPDPYGSDLETYRGTAQALEKEMETLEF
jgi:protein-tyrosine-phosphatase